MNNQEFNDFFNKGDYVPAFRHTETYLLAATAGFLLGNASEALTYVNALRARRGDPDLTVLSLNDLYLEFNTELNQEGEGFIVMKIFDNVDDELQLEGYRYLLPIPSDVLEANPDIAQKPGLLATFISPAGASGEYLPARQGENCSTMPLTVIKQ